MEKCTGCGICEMICSLVHEGECNHSLSRIKIIKKGEEWIRGTSSNIFDHTVCKQCGFCVNVCPAKAISKNDTDGSISIDASKCIKCLKCVNECPFNAMKYATKGKVIVCDLCNSTKFNEPMCVRMCPPKVLKLVKVK